MADESNTGTVTNTIDNVALVDMEENNKPNHAIEDTEKVEMPKSPRGFTLFDAPDENEDPRQDWAKLFITNGETTPRKPTTEMIIYCVTRLINAIQRRRVAGENSINGSSLRECGLRDALIRSSRETNVLSKNIDPYVNCFRALDVTDRQGLDTLMDQQSLQCPEIQQLQEQLRTAENEWDALLKKIDALITEQDLAPPEKTHEDRRKIRLVDCDTSKSMTVGSLMNQKYGKHTLFVVARFYGCYASERYIKTLEEHLEDFQRKLCNVIIVCKGTKEGGRKWRQVIGIRLPVLADEMGEFLSSFHFPISVWNMYRTSERCHLAAASITQTLHLIDDKEKDFYQLGGEVLLCNRGKQFFLHKCQTTEDRPPWDELLQLIVTGEVKRPVSANVASTVTWETGKLTNTAKKSLSCSIV